MTSITEKRALSADEIDLVAGGNVVSPNVKVSVNVNAPFNLNLAIVDQINVAVAKTVYQNNVSVIWTS